MAGTFGAVAAMGAKATVVGMFAIELDRLVFKSIGAIGLTRCV